MDLHNWPYRLKSARRKKRLVIKDRDKQLIKIHKLRKELWQQKRHLPMVPLKNPYQSGWKRFFVLREDVARDDKAGFYQTVLAKINTVRYHHEKSFKKKKWRKQRYRYELKEQLLKEIDWYDWSNNKLKLSEEEKACFTRVERSNIYSKKLEVIYVFAEPWRFVLKTVPHIITEVKMLDSSLERQIDALDNYITKHYLTPRIDCLTHGRLYRWRGGYTEPLKYINKFKNIPRNSPKEAYED
ncbi:hypothetical protein [Mucilaginibacter paludis]|uniref:Uncharacterized protein n=1 Tax=Mucilaginibacter paludis DSM 18603 TaxID=714943 RepID=H1Y8T0_9SPHI|nr:hypothetical protein [Mucilaginibacter paludis]EHQ28696.1 hypothetical protein Mucpa_4607 [Mucilaginibacter paludis DSM 18603]